MIKYLCISLQIIGLVWPTRFVLLTMGEVLSFGFNLAVSSPIDINRASEARIVLLPSRIKRWGLLKEVSLEAIIKLLFYISLYHDKCLLFMLELYSLET